MFCSAEKAPLLAQHQPTHVGALDHMHMSVQVTSMSLTSCVASDNLSNFSEFKFFSL